MAEEVSDTTALFIYFILIPFIVVTSYLSYVALGFWIISCFIYGLYKFIDDWLLSHYE